MTNYTKETYQTKRDILNFTKKIAQGTRKATYKLAQDIVYGILTRKNCYLSEIARALKEKTKLAYTIDRLSSNLMNLDKEEILKIKNNYYEEVMNYLPENYIIVLNDDTELNKEYSKKIEDLCIVRDASSQVERYVNGYKVCEYVALSKDKKSPISLYSNVYSTTRNTFISENEETLKGENFVIDLLNSYKRNAIFIRDRGYDANEYFVKDIKEDNKFVTRLKGTRYLLFKDKKKIVKEVANKRKGKIVTKLRYQGENIECSISYTKVKLPAYSKKEVNLVLVYGLGKEPMMLLTNLEVKGKESAEYIVKLYLLRWRVEEYFKAKKSYNWENSLIRNIDAMNNLNLFLTISMLHLSILTEKLNTNYNSNIILERAELLKNKILVYLSAMGTGIVEILKNARTGIREWQCIETRNKYKQLELKL